MRVIQVVAGIGAEASGPSYSVPKLVEALNAVGAETGLHVLAPLPARNLQCPVVAYQVDESPIPNLGRSRAMLQGLKAKCRSAEILHNNGLWMMPNVYSAKAVKGTCCKLVMAPRGCLAPWALAKGGLKKKIFGMLLQYPALRAADMFHATSEKEYEEIRAFGLKQPVAIVPIGMEVPRVGLMSDVSEVSEVSKFQSFKVSKGQGCKVSEFQRGKVSEISEFQRGKVSEVSEFQGCKVSEGQSFKVSKFQSGEGCGGGRSEAGLRTLAFFGRVHRVKAIDTMLLAWKELADQFPDWRVVVAGPDCGDRGRLEGIIAEGRIPRVEFVGELNGQAKYEFLATSDLYCLPSKTENFGITVAEALACGTPSLASGGTPWQLINDYQCGSWGFTTVEQLVLELRRLMALSDAERQTLGERGRQLVRERLSWSAIGCQMLAAYEWLVNGGECPSCVRLT